MHFRISRTMNAEDIFRCSIGCEIMLMIKARIRLIFSRYNIRAMHTCVYVWESKRRFTLGLCRYNLVRIRVLFAFSARDIRKQVREFQRLVPVACANISGRGTL